MRDVEIKSHEEALYQEKNDHHETRAQLKAVEGILLLVLHYVSLR
jgi:hypothetical protein